MPEDGPPTVAPGAKAGRQTLLRQGAMEGRRQTPDRRRDCPWHETAKNAENAKVKYCVHTCLCSVFSAISAVGGACFVLAPHERGSLRLKYCYSMYCYCLMVNMIDVVSILQYVIQNKYLLGQRSD